MSGPKEVGTGKRQDEQLELSPLVDLLNERFGTEFTDDEQLFFDQVKESLATDSELLEDSAKANSKENFRYVAEEKLAEAFLNRHGKNEEIVEKIYDDEGFGVAVMELLADRLYEGFREEKG